MEHHMTEPEKPKQPAELFKLYKESEHYYLDEFLEKEKKDGGKHLMLKYGKEGGKYLQDTYRMDSYYNLLYDDLKRELRFLMGELNKKIYLHREAYINENKIEDPT